MLNELVSPTDFQKVYKEYNADAASMVLSVKTGLDRNDISNKNSKILIILTMTLAILINYKRRIKRNN